MNTDFPRDNLIRMNTDVRADVADDGRRVLHGVPIVFNEWTTIRGWEGEFEESIAPGALTKTLDERGDRVKVLFNHGFDPSIGEKPLGKPSRQAVTDHGLEVEVPLSDTAYNRDLAALLDDGAIDGMSFKFGVVSDRWDNLDSDDGSLPRRTITELKLYEYGPVTFPAYEATTVGVRSASEYNEFRRRADYLDREIHVQRESDQIPDAADAGTSPDNADPTRDQSAIRAEMAKAIRAIDLTLI